MRPGLSVTVVSTHFDDAVFSCWTVIASSADVDVLTVFTAGPDDDRVTDWDSDSGLTSALRMKQRAVENDAALALAGRAATNLGALERQYGGGAVDVSALEGHLSRAEIVYVPAAIAIDRHPHADHVAVRDACLSLRPDACLYADNPYCHFRGDIYLPANLAKDRTRAAVELTPPERARKAAAIRCYAGELAKLEGHFPGCADEGALAFELFWSPAGSARLRA